MTAPMRFVVVPGISAMRSHVDEERGCLRLQCPGCGESWEIPFALADTGEMTQVTLAHEDGCRFEAIVNKVESGRRLTSAEVAQVKRWKRGETE